MVSIFSLMIPTKKKRRVKKDIITKIVKKMKKIIKARRGVSDRRGMSGWDNKD